MSPDDASSLPPYAFVPGGPWPHPAAHDRPPAKPIAADAWDNSPEYRRGIALFNAGYYWEAHEEWEALWQAEGRRGPTADILRALIKLAAAGVKVRERQTHGIVTHAGRAARLFESASAEGGPMQLGLDLVEAAAVARQIAGDPPTDLAPPGTRVARVFSFRIEPRCAGDSGTRFPSLSVLDSA